MEWYIPNCIIDLFKVKLTAEKRVVPKRKAVVPISNYSIALIAKLLDIFMLQDII